VPATEFDAHPAGSLDEAGEHLPLVLAEAEPSGGAVSILGIEDDPKDCSLNEGVGVLEGGLVGLVIGGGCGCGVVIRRHKKIITCQSARVKHLDGSSPGEGGDDPEGTSYRWPRPGLGTGEAASLRQLDVNVELAVRQVQEPVTLEVRHLLGRQVDQEDAELGIVDLDLAGPRDEPPHYGGSLGRVRHKGPGRSVDLSLPSACRHTPLKHIDGGHVKVLDGMARMWFNGRCKRGDRPPGGGEAMAPIEDHMVAIASYIEVRGGEVRTEPGQLIKEIAEAVFGVTLEPGFLHRSRDYCATARALVELEAIGLIEIERAGWHRSERANKLVAVRLL